MFTGLIFVFLVQTNKTMKTTVRARSIQFTSSLPRYFFFIMVEATKTRPHDLMDYLGTQKNKPIHEIIPFH